MSKLNGIVMGFAAMAMLPMMIGCDLPPETGTGAAPTGDPSQVSDDASAFENGINKSYLAYRGIDEATFLEELRARGESPSGDDTADGVESSTQALTAAELGFLNIPAMIARPGDYFYVSLEAVATPSPGLYANVGFNTQKLNDSLKLVNYAVKDTSFNKIYIRNVSVRGVTNSAINLRGQVQAKHYEKKPWPFKGYWLIYDKTGSVDLTLNYAINSATNTLTFSKFTASNIQLETSIIQYLVFPVNIVIDGVVSLLNISGDLNQAVPLSFLPPRYVQLTSIATNQLYIMFKLRLMAENMKDDFLNTVRSLGVPIR